MAPQDSQICGGNFPKRKNSAAELCQILRMITIHTHTVLTAIFPDEPGLAGCPFSIYSWTAHPL